MPPPVNPGDIDRMLKSLMDVTTVFQATMDQLTIGMGELGKLVQENVKGMKEMADNAKETVEEVDRIKGNLSDLARLMRLAGEPGGVLNTKNNAEVLKSLQSMIAKVRELQKQDFGARGAKALEDALERLVSMMKKTKAASTAAADPKEWSEMVKVLKDLGYNLDTVTKKFSKVPGVLSSIGTAFKDAFGQMGTLGPLMAPIERMASMNKQVGYMKAGAVEQRQKGAEIFRQKAQEKGGSFGELMGKLELDEKGKIDKEVLKKLRTDPENKRRAKEIAEMKEGDLQDLMQQYSGRKGRLGKREAINAAKGVRAFATEFAGAAEGEEVAGAGIGAAGDVVAGGGSAMAGGAAELAGPIGIAIMAVTAMKDLFDGMIKSNKDIYTRLGTAGLLTHAPNAFEAFQNVRANLTRGPNAYGQTKEENMRIAETIAKFGVSVGDLAEAGNDLKKNIIGYAEAGRGTNISTIVHHGGAMLGLSDVQTTEQIMKLLQQYHISLQGTDTFFNELISDTKAAGLSTTKYLQIIEEITNQFDHMSRGIDAVTSALRNLGHTGLLTSEMVEDSMKAMMTTKAAPEVNAYLLMQMSPAERAGAFRSMQQGTQRMGANALDAAEKAYTDSGKSKAEFESDKKAWGITEQSINTPQGATSLERMLGAELGNEPGVADVSKKTALGAAKQLGASMMQTRAFGAFAANPSAQGALGVTFGARQTPEMAAIENSEAFLTALRKAGGYSSEKEAYTAAVTNNLDPANNPKLALLIQTLTSSGKTVDDMLNALAPMQQAVAAQVTAAKQGNITDEDAKTLAKYIPGFKGEANAKTVQSALKDEKTFQNTIKNMGTDPKAFRDFWSPMSEFSKSLTEQARVKGEQEALKGKTVGEALQDTDQILQSILDVLETKIFGGLTTLIKWFVKPSLSEEQQTNVEKAMNASVRDPGSMKADLEKLKAELDVAQQQADAAQKHIDDVRMTAEKTAKGSPERKALSDLMNQQRYRNEDIANLKSKIGMTEDTMALGHHVFSKEEYDKFFGGVQQEHQAAVDFQKYIHPAAAPGGAATIPSAQDIKGKETKGGDVNVSTKNDTTITHVNTDPAQHNTDITKGKEVTPLDAKRQAEAAAAAKTKSSRVMVTG